MHKSINKLAAASTTIGSNAHSTQLIDQFGREKHKLRISLTDRCNFRCRYCMPEQPEWLPKKEMLSFDELFSFCQLMVSLGIRHIRLTGGEPLLRPKVVDFVQQLSPLKAHGLQRISMTTNGYYLKQLAAPLKHAGLDDINISLDSIDPATFLSMTQRDIAPVLEGIAAAQQANLAIKLNCVLMAGQNDHQIVQLTQWAFQQQIQLRFIEYMPLDQAQHWQSEKVVTEDQAIALLCAHFDIEKQQRQHDPATIYLLNQQYKLGFISTISKPFCQSCDRLRLTATGEFFSCLFAATGTPLKALIQQHMQQDIQQSTQQQTPQPMQQDIQNHIQQQIPQQSDSLLSQTLLQAVWHKKAGFIAHQAAPIRKITMHAIGG